MTKVIPQRPKPHWAHQVEAGPFVLMLAGPTRESLARKESMQAVQAIEPGMSTWKQHSNTCIEAEVRATGAAAFELWQAVANQLPDVDTFMLPASARNIKLLVCDMDSTIIPTESLDELAGFLGIGEQIAQITRRAMAGELDFEEALKARVSQLGGMDYSFVEKCVRQTSYNPGAQALLVAAKQAGVRTVLVSGGFSPFVEHVAQQLGFDRWVANHLIIDNNKLTGEVGTPIVDKTTKLEVLNTECLELGIHPSKSCTIGDGANDIDMLTGAGCGVAYRAKTIVLEATPYHLQHADFSVLPRLFQWV